MTDAIEKLRAVLGERYAIEREIARGAVAYVYLAEDLKHGRKVALKVLNPNMRHVVEGRRFLEEIRVTAKLSHPNILPLFDSGEIEGLLYYVMPYVDGETLAARLDREGQLPVSHAISIATEVANALDFAHKHGVVHRDIKPGNVLLQAGRPVISDFGIALGLASDPDQRVTGHGLMVGTPEYMSPEQAHADPGIDGRSDIYSLGAVLYEMLAGSPPFVGKDVHSVLTKVIKERPEPVSEKREFVPRAVEHAILKALEKQPSERFGSAAEFAAALRPETRATRPVSMEAETDSRYWRRSKLPWVAAVLVFVAAVVGVALGYSGGPETLIAGRTLRLTNALGLELDPAISPDGSKVAYAAGPLGSMKLYIRDVDVGATSVALTDTISGHHRWPRWSPDGSQIVFLNNGPGESSIQVIPASGGAPRTLVRSEGGEREIFGASWSPDGTRIAYGMRGGIFAVPAVGGEPRRLVPMVDGHSPVWSPDGSRIAFVSGNPTFTFGTFVIGNIAPSALWTVSVRDGTAVRLTETTFLHTSPVWTRDGRSLVFVSNHDGRRDIYQLPVARDGSVDGTRMRLTTGLDAHSVTLGGDDSLLVYSLFRQNSNVWALDIPARGVTSTTTAVAITGGNQTIEGMSVSTDGEWLAYDSDLNGTQDVYRLRIGENEPQRLTSDPRDDFYPAWTLDGRELAFYSFRSGKRDVWMMDADGSNEIRITSDSGHNRAPQWSPDGNSIVYHSDKTGRAELFVVTRDSSGNWGAPRQLTSDGGFNPHWSPDGRRIVYVGSETIRVIPAEGGEPEALTSRSTESDGATPWSVAWSPDGEYVYYKAFDSVRRSSFWRVPATGGVPRLLAEFDDPDFQSLRNEFATDGKRLFFTVSEQESDIWIMNLREGGGGVEVGGF